MEHTDDLQPEPPSPEEDDPDSSSSDFTAAPTGSFIKKLKGKLARLLRFNNNSLEEEVADLIEERDPEGKQISPEERNILNKVLSLGDKNISSIMVPRPDIIAIEESSGMDKLKKIIVDKAHTRIPVYKESLDNITGFVHIKDIIPLIGSSKKIPIEEVVREILFAPPSMKILDLLVKMRAKRVHVALVLDEYGGTDGLVTLEDLMEEIVGEIEDEHDDIQKNNIEEIKEDVFEVNARTTIEELENVLDMQIKHDDDDDYDTVGGLIFFMLGRVPEVGEVIEHEAGLELIIRDADPRRIKNIIIKRST